MNYEKKKLSRKKKEIKEKDKRQKKDLLHQKKLCDMEYVQDAKKQNI